MAKLGGKTMAISINLYLDNRSAKKSNIAPVQEFPVKLTITKDRTTAYLPTGVKVETNQWKNRAVTGRKDKARLNDYLDSFKSRVKSLVYDGLENRSYYEMTATEIKNDILTRMGKDESRDKSARFLDIYDKFAEGRRSERTREIYRVTGRKIRSLFPQAGKIRINQVDLDWLENLDDLLVAKGNNGSTRSIDFRNIRAVLKYAQKHKLLQENPFDDFSLPEGESRDRSLTADQLRTLIHAEVESWERKYLDFFILSFLLIGMNTEDLLHVDKIKDGRINYIRAKTHKPMSVKVEEEARTIFEKYRGEKYLLNILDTYSQTHGWTAKVDAALKRIAKRNALPPVTMYWARHTWATLASVDLGVDLSTISDALGHQPEKKVTLTYIKRRDYKKVDEANSSMVKYIFNG